MAVYAWEHTGGGNGIVGEIGLMRAQPSLWPRRRAAPLRVRAEIGSQILGVEAPGWQDAKVQGYLDIASFRNAARRDGSAYKM